jgi:hypothetical protein
MKIEVIMNGKSFLIDNKLWETTQDISNSRSGGIFNVKGYVPTTNYVECPIVDIRGISRISVLSLYNRKIEKLKNLQFSDIVIKGEKLEKLEERKQIELFLSCKQKMVESMNKTIDGVRDDVYRIAHDTFYIQISDGIKLHFQTEKIDGKTPIDSFEWVILGGESGDDYGKYRYRECREKWIHETFAPLLKMGKYVFVKQVGTFVSKNDPKQKGKQDRHGTYMNLWSKAIQIQEVPPWKLLETNGFSKVQMGQKFEKNNFEALNNLYHAVQSIINESADKATVEKQRQSQKTLLLMKEFASEFKKTNPDEFYRRIYEWQFSK